jgi:hypothetical protein
MKDVLRAPAPGERLPARRSGRFQVGRATGRARRRSPSPAPPGAKAPFRPRGRPRRPRLDEGLLALVRCLNGSKVIKKVDLARAVGVSPSQLSNILAGYRGLDAMQMRRGLTALLGEAHPIPLAPVRVRTGCDKLKVHVQLAPLCHDGDSVAPWYELLIPASSTMGACHRWPSRNHRRVDRAIDVDGFKLKRTKMESLPLDKRLLKYQYIRHIFDGARSQKVGGRLRALSGGELPAASSRRSASPPVLPMLDSRRGGSVSPRPLSPATATRSRMRGLHAREMARKAQLALGGQWCCIRGRLRQVRPGRILAAS